jgi:2-polyprenyl-3-methyl-5-hydroxy-6-metoxy-1,4-benzoquinol methylase
MEEIDDMRQINEAQRKYYEQADGTATSEANNFLTNAYRQLRGAAYDVLQSIEVDRTIRERHRSWLPSDLSGQTVLDLGAGTGTEFSVELARRSGNYVATDLSSSSLDVLQEKLEEAGVSDCTRIQGDFLDPDFPKTGYDVVYAHSVMHHFRHLDPFLDILSERMNAGGIVLTRDPLQTWGPYRLFRVLYRPFQADSAWEHPFTRSSLATIRDHFHVDRVQGVVGRSKWGLPLALFDTQWARQVAKRGHERDLKEATSLDDITHCLQVAMRLVPRV